MGKIKHKYTAGILHGNLWSLTFTDSLGGGINTEPYNDIISMCMVSNNHNNILL